jgi:hypothetical protein
MSTPVSQDTMTAQRSTSGDHAWIPTVDSPGLISDVAKDEAVSTSVSRSTAAEKRTMSDRDATVSSEGAADADIVSAQGREERRASRRGSRQASRQSFQRPPLKKRIVGLSPRSYECVDLLTRMLSSDRAVCCRATDQEGTDHRRLFESHRLCELAKSLARLYSGESEHRKRGTRALGTGRLR